MKRVIKDTVFAGTIGLCILFIGCSRTYIERTDRWIKDYREHAIRPGQRIFLSNESRRPRPVPMGAPNIDVGHISVNPGSINVSAP